MEIVSVVEFMRADPSVVVHIGIMSICNAVGQSFIYYTIKTFGPPRDLSLSFSSVPSHPV